MQVGFLVTNGGPHSPEKWAAASAGQIIQIAADATGEQAIAGRRLELKLLDILEHWHTIIQQNEEAELDERGVLRYDDPLTQGEDVDDPLAEILQAAVGTPFEAHFAQESVQAHIREVLRRDFATAQEIARKWHQDQNPQGAI